jgi:hypothetical protein
MTNSLEDEVERIVESMDEQYNSREQESPESEATDQQPEETIHIHYFPDAIVILKEVHEAQLVDNTPVIPQKISFLPAYAICCFYFLLIVSTLVFQVYEILNPPIATVTIMPKSQQVTLSGTLQLGRVLPPLTISQSQTVPTTGKGHQDARSATGFITFYNGQFQRVFIVAGTILTGASGMQVVIDQEADIPAANPPIFGQVTVSAHAINQGIKGNIPAYDINQACCAASVLAKNTQSFTGGQDERDFQTVAKSDIDTVATPLKTEVAQSVNGAFQGQLKPDEQVFILPCHPTVVSDHQPGDEATRVNATVSQTCSAVAFNTQALAEKATTLLSSQAQQQPGAGYSLIGQVQVSVRDATITNSSKVFLALQASGTWVHALSQIAQQQIKRLISGKTQEEALHILLSVPGIERVSLSWAEDTTLPRDPDNIRIVLFSAGAA